LDEIVRGPGLVTGVRHSESITINQTEENMKRFFHVALMLSVFFSLVSAQDPVFFNGDIPDSMSVWTWGFADNEAAATPVPNSGYSPGTKAIRWTAYNGDGYQGIFLYFDSYEGVDMSPVWATDSVYFKLRAPNGLDAADPNLNVVLYDPTDTNVWDYCAWYEVPNFHDIDDGAWHQFAVALADLQVWTTPIDQTNIIAVSFEFFDTGISSQFLIDEVWIGNQNVSQKMTIFNGNEVVPNLNSYYRWGFADDSFQIAEGEGATEGTNAMLWENNTEVYGGLGFEFDLHDMSWSWQVDTVKLKVKAPAGINDLMLVWWDWNWNTAEFVIDASVVTWDGTWKSLEIPMSDFTVNDGFDKTIIYSISIQPATAPIPERILFDDFWIGNPDIDIVAPGIPQNVIADVTTPYINFIYWNDIAEETGETYDVYASLSEITDLNAPGVFQIAQNIAEGDAAYHYLYYPLEDGPVSYYYAVTCTDAAGNSSPGPGVSAQAYQNTGAKRPVISLEPPQNFVADSYLDEWQHIEPFTLHPDRNLILEENGTITDSLDYSLKCYVAMDPEYLYVAFDVFDDNFTWQPENTQPWWEDESIEFYFGLYERGQFHTSFDRGAEPDYRLVFLPDKLLLYNGDSLMTGSTEYIFEPLGGFGGADYIIEARIPFSQIQLAEDSVFTVTEGMAIPFEIFATDADVVDGSADTRIQLGSSPDLNPWGMSTQSWTFSWIGIPVLSSIGEDIPVVYAYSLADNYPNPFNPETRIEYVLAETGKTELSIYNAVGQKIRTLVNERQTAGRHHVRFDGQGFASGIYFYRVTSGEFSQTKKMLLIK
jgi:hypothetical protein